MKGSLANIGAPALSEMAGKLEIASGRSDVHACVSNLPPFLDGLSVFNFGLKEAFAKRTRHDGPIEIPSELPDIFKKMTDAFGEMDFAAIDQEMGRLDALEINSALQEEIERIKYAVLLMDYDSAAEVMQNLLR